MQKSPRSVPRTMAAATRAGLYASAAAAAPVMARSSSGLVLLSSASCGVSVSGGYATHTRQLYGITSICSASANPRSANLDEE